MRLKGFVYFPSMENRFAEMMSNASLQSRKKQKRKVELREKAASPCTAAYH